jgi:hypothetical protein
MAAATAAETLWGFVYWLKRNPFKSIEAGMTHADLDAMLKSYCTTNATDATLSTDPGAYGATQDYPAFGATGLGDGTGVSATTPSNAICEQSFYPDQHRGA